MLSWFLFAIGAMVFFTAMFLIQKKILMSGLGSAQLLMYVFFFGAVITLVYLLSTKSTLSINKTLFILLILAAVFAFLGNYFLLRSINVAPNPGYSLAVSGVHILLVTILAIFLFKSDYDWTKIVGTVLAMLGIILLGWK